jgi:hypothetical protein
MCFDHVVSRPYTSPDTSILSPADTLTLVPALFHPSVQSDIEDMPISKDFRQTTPLTTIFTAVDGRVKQQGTISMPACPRRFGGNPHLHRFFLGMLSVVSFRRNVFEEVAQQIGKSHRAENHHHR